eukprot:2704012-Rhodomonas_salina.2
MDRPHSERASVAHTLCILRESGRLCLSRYHVDFLRPALAKSPFKKFLKFLTPQVTSQRPLQHLTMSTTACTLNLQVFLSPPR